MNPSNRQASGRRGGQFEALAAFANMGSEPADWKRFRLKFPEFFPLTPSNWGVPGFTNLTDWIYASAIKWSKDFGPLRGQTATTTPLLWYRDILRSVWAGNDQTGAGLYVLYGYEKRARPLGLPVRDAVARPLLIPGQSTIPHEQETSGLPQGEPQIDGVSGTISWKFGCELQQSVYELMQCRWRARVCIECGRYFIAGKTAQTLCSTVCSGEAKRKRALAHWHRKGSAARDRRRKRRPVK